MSLPEELIPWVDEVSAALNASLVALTEDEKRRVLAELAATIEDATYLIGTSEDVDLVSGFVSMRLGALTYFVKRKSVEKWQAEFLHALQAASVAAWNALLPQFSPLLLEALRRAVEKILEPPAAPA